MTGPASLKWGLIGASDIAETRMLPALRRTGHRVVAVQSGSPAHAETYASRNGIAIAVTELSHLLERTDIDAVYLSSVNQRHLPQAAAAAAAGKHILCEKPLTPTLEDSLALITAAREAGVVLGVNHHLPAAGTHRTIRELVRDGAVGTPLAVNVRHATLLPERLRGWRLSDEPGAGAVMDLSCHDASVVNPLLAGKPLEVSAITVRQGPWEAFSEDASQAVVRYTGNVLVHMHDSFTSPFTPTYLEVHGDAGSIHASDVMTPEPIGTVLLTDDRGQREIAVADRRHTYDITLEAFTAAVLGAGRPVVTGEDAFNAMSVSVSILESARTGQRQPVEWI